MSVDFPPMLSYKDVVLLPNYSAVLSRAELDTSVDFLGVKFKSPIIPANMACTSSFEKAEEFSKNGYFYILHRFYPYWKILAWMQEMHLECVSISVGVQRKDVVFLREICYQNLKCDFITIDVAHGHHLNVREMMKTFHELPWRHKPKLIVGNAGTPQAVLDLVSWGADSVKVGLSCGFSCETYNATGVGTPMYSLVKDCASQSKIPIIADGQVREVGDSCKALNAGATMVMVGSLFAACCDSPAPNDWRGNKIFFGSASAENKGHNEFIEGKSSILKTSKKTMMDRHREFEQGIKSAMSYAGAFTPHEIRKMSARTRII